MDILFAKSEADWESFLQSQPWTPFLQSFPMGEVYRKVGAEPIRLEVRDESCHAEERAKRASRSIVGICQAIVVPAKRGKHLAVSYGPVLAEGSDKRQAASMIIEELKRIARERGCAFIRMSPFWSRGDIVGARRAVPLQDLGFRPSPLHLLAEHVWLLPLQGKSEEDIRKSMRSTTRNLIGRAEREGVTIELSPDPVRDLHFFLSLHDETRKRHGFTPYTNDFFKAQVEVFSRPSSVTLSGVEGPSPARCALYLARYNGEVVSTSIHMVYGGETSYHHGASTLKYPKIPASYLLQWRAIQDAMKRGDRVYNFWGVSPEGVLKHPFAGVRTFKTGFGGELLELQHCMDLPLSKKYFLTWGIETFRKWRRGF